MCNGFYEGRIESLEEQVERLQEQIAELRKKVHILNEANMKLENELGRFAEASKKVEHLQEQLAEANAIIKDMRPFIQGSMKRETFTRILRYEDKWGVK